MRVSQEGRIIIFSSFYGQYCPFTHTHIYGLVWQVVILVKKLLKLKSQQFILKVKYSIFYAIFAHLFVKN